MIAFRLHSSVHCVLGLLLAAVLASPLAAQGRGRRASTRASGPSSPAPAPRLSVALVSTDSAPDDSLLAIVSRDLEWGDQVHVLPGDSATTALRTVRLGATPEGVQAAIADSLGTVRERRTFSVAVVPPARDSAITDSVDSAFAAREAVRRAVLAGASAFRDSLGVLLAKKPPHFWTRGARKRYDEQVAARRAEVFASLAQDSVIAVEARRDAAARDSARTALVARDRAVRDSIAAERRWAIHGIADAIQEWTTTRRGIAQSRLAYVAGDGSLHVVDADGANDRVVERGGKALSPAWRHDGHALVFSDLADAGTQIGWVDLTNDSVHFFTATPRGLNIAPAYSPDDRWIVFGTAAESGTRLVAMRADSTSAVRPIRTTGSYDATEPTFSPDGGRIAFVSPRPGRPQIYSAALDGSDERLETPRVKGTPPYRTGPDWSPDGRFIAFQQQNGPFQVWLLDRATKQVRRLTTVGQNEDPSWAPDSRHLAVTSDRDGTRAIWILDVPTGRARRLTAGEGRLAAWSPRLQSAR